MHSTDCQFGEFQLDTRVYQLRRKGVPLKLERIPLDLLILLLDRPGKLVSREEIFQSVWGKNLFLDADNAINSAVRKLRRALGDNPDAPRFVETVPGRGYRFIAKLTTGSTENASLEPISTPRRPGAIMVGREAELARLRAWSAQAFEGRRRIVFIAGETGIGKTAFMTAFLDSLGITVRIGRGQCVEQYGAGEPYMPVLEALTRLCHGPGAGWLVELMHKYAPTWLAQMPSLLNDADRERVYGNAESITKQRMLREMAQALEVIAAETPLVLVVEDLHWSDRSTLELIVALARRTEAARLLIIGTYRPGEMVGSDHPLRALKPELELHRYCDELRLKLLSEADVAAYLAKRFVDHDTAQSVAGLAPLIYDRTEGNPLFMVSMVDYLVEQGLSLDPDKIEVPGSIFQMIERNLERRKPDEQRVLEAASVAGVKFSAAAVAAALQNHVTEVEGYCSRLSRHEQFISVDGVCDWPDGTVTSKYRFQHSLYADVLYRRIPAGYRLELHRRIAEREEEAYSECASEIAAELAHHYSRANDRNKAIEYFQLAGERATARCAMPEAEDHYANALALLSKLPETAERNRLELELQLAVGRARIAIKGWAAPDVENAYIRGRQLFEEQGNAAQLFSVLYGRWVSHLVRLDVREAYQIGEELMLQAKNAGDPTLLLQAQQALGNTLCQMGRFHLAKQHLEKAISLCTGRRARPLSVDLEVASRSYLSWTLWFLGYPDQALKMSYKAVEVAQALSDPFSLLLAEIFLCQLQQHRRELRAVQETAERVSAICTEHGFLFGAASATLRRGAVMIEDGRGEEGLEQIQQGLAAHRATGAKVNRPEFLCWLAKGYCATGQLAQALDTINDALRVSEERDYLLLQAEMYRLKGDFLLHKSGFSFAEVHACFARGIDIAQSQGAKSLELSSTASLAQLLAKQGRPQEARVMLAEIYRWFTEGFDTADLKDAKTLLDSLND